MKFLIVTVVALVSQMTFAACLGEAQIVASVKKVVRITPTSCLAFVDQSSVSVYNVNQTCSLDLNEVLASGIVISSWQEHCSNKVGDVLSGVVVKDTNSVIVLE